MIYLIIAGGRDFNDYAFIKSKLNYLLRNISEPVTVLCGKCKGVDELGERYAKERGWAVDYYPANWDEHGKAAGPIRNEKMAKKATHCITFWDGKSKGTRSMIDLANKYNLKSKIVRY